jgi:hypothetical protein
MCLGVGLRVSAADGVKNHIDTLAARDLHHLLKKEISIMIKYYV